MDTLLQLIIVAAVAVSPAIIKWAKEKIKKTGQAFSKNLQTRAKIAELIKEIRIYLDANRVAIFEYSNTEKAINGLPFDYITITYEDTDQNTVPIASQFKKIPIGQFATQLIEIDKADKWVLETTTHTDPEVVYNLRQYNTEMVYHFKITKHLRDGVVSIVFNREIDEFSSEKIDYVNYKCWEIYNLMKKLS